MPNEVATKPVGPAVGVGAIILDGDNVLLIRRGNEPALGKWSLPGGRVHWGETLKDAVEREALEETGLVVETQSVAGIFESIWPKSKDQPDFHYVVIDYFCKVLSGDPCCGDDATDISWWPLEAIDDLDTTDKLGGKLTEWIALRR
jgi:8-oxo-dGTP diphosphatase